MGFAF